MDRIYDTILRVYDATVDDALWPDVLQRVSDEIGAVGCIVFEWQGPPESRKLVSSLASSFYEPAQIARYIDTCQDAESRDQDIFEEHSLISDGVDLIDDRVIAPTLDALRRRPNVAVLLKLGILHRAAGLLNKDNTAISRFSVQLGADRGRFSPAEQDYLSSVLPHLAKAMDLGRPARQLAMQQHSLIAAMDRLSIGICILDGAGRVVVSNSEFSRQAETYNVFFNRKGGQLQFRRAKDQARFETLKEHVFNHGKYGARPRKETISTGQNTFLCIEATPLQQAAEFGTARFDGIILYSTDTSLPVRCHTHPIGLAYGLTNTELELVDMIAEGLTNAQISERRGRAIATINTQVKSILSKTHCATRTQFVRLMMSFGADLLMPEFHQDIDQMGDDSTVS